MAHRACIVPPHILEAMTRNGDATTRDWALRTLSIDTTLRNARVIAELQRRRPAQAPAPAAAPHKMRRIYTAHNTTDLPGTLVRSEGQPPSGDAAVDDGPAKYAGTLVGNVATGTQSTFSGMNGCWYLMKQDTTVGAISPGGGAASRESYDVAGNPVGSLRRPN